MKPPLSVRPIERPGSSRCKGLGASLGEGAEAARGRRLRLLRFRPGLLLASVILELAQPGASGLAGAAPPAAPAGAEAGVIPPLRRGTFTVSAEDKAWWSFQPVRRPVLPTVRNRARVNNAIDVFLLARLEDRGLGFNPPASRRELLRRLSFDLAGLPPTPEEVEAFETDRSPAAWETQVNRLLASPRYGERWGRHWLDLVRYAESNGYERDGAKPFAWRYRDYVIDSLNQDKPYDRFLVEQLAGDELPYSRDAVIATGFYRLHVWDDEPDSTLAAEFDDLDDIMVATSATFLGLTVGCARCHDHKFDPISQADYYRMLSHLRSIQPYGQHHQGGGGRGTGQITKPLASPAEIAAWETARRSRLEPFRRELAGTPDASVKTNLEAHLKRIESEPPPWDFALAIHEDPVRPTHVLHRGDVNSPGEEVQPGWPAVLGAAAPPAAPGMVKGGAPSGRRLALARWLAGEENPLTARVAVNRLWQHHFGRGLVPTPNDFGRTGEAPSHPELLDYLAHEFMAGGWRLKRMHKLLLMSQAYQMSSRMEGAKGRARDEPNGLLWHQNPRRAEAEVVRDSLLAISGTLSLKMAGPGVFPVLPREVHATQDSSGKGWGESPPAERQRRTIYLAVKRALLLPLLETFDYTTTTVPVGLRPSTTVAPQALMLLNDGLVTEQAACFSDRLLREAGPGLDAQVRRAFALAVQRAPDETELAAARQLIAEQDRLQPAAPATGNRAGDPPAHTGRGLRTFCAALLNLNEVLYVD